MAYRDGRIDLRRDQKNKERLKQNAYFIVFEAIFVTNLLPTGYFILYVFVIFHTPEMIQRAPGIHPGAVLIKKHRMFQSAPDGIAVRSAYGASTAGDILILSPVSDFVNILKKSHFPLDFTPI